MTPDLSHKLEGEREEDVCAKILNVMSKKNKIKKYGVPVHTVAVGLLHESVK